MSGEVRGRLECSRTAFVLTGEGGVSSVGPQVDSQLAAVLALVRTDLTVVRPLVCMDPHMFLKSGALHGLVITGSASEGFVARVNLEVSVELVLTTKALETNLTGEGSLSCVNCHVSRQILRVFRHKQTAYEGALVELPVCRLLLCCLLGASSLRLLLLSLVEMNRFLLVLQAQLLLSTGSRRGRRRGWRLHQNARVLKL